MNKYKNLMEEDEYNDIFPGTFEVKKISKKQKKKNKLKQQYLESVADLLDGEPADGSSFENHCRMLNG